MGASIGWQRETIHQNPMERAKTGPLPLFFFLGKMDTRFVKVLRPILWMHKSCTTLKPWLKPWFASIYQANRILPSGFLIEADFATTHSITQAETSRRTVGSKAQASSLKLGAGCWTSVHRPRFWPLGSAMVLRPRAFHWAGNRTPAKDICFAWLVENKGDPKKAKRQGS